MVQQIADCTNKYAWMHIFEKSTYAKKDGSWAETSVLELYKLIGILMYFGLCYQPKMGLYWSRKRFWHREMVAKTMSRDRFKALLAFFHVVDPDTEDPNDRLSKIRSFLDALSEKCSTLFQPYRNVSVDERMVKSKAKTSGMRQFMKNKPVRFGFKLWVLADSITSYTWKFFVYTGHQQEFSPHGLGYDVVVYLSEKLQHQGYTIFVDNFYTSPGLLQDLYLFGITACGTCRENRKDFPPSLLGSKRWGKTVDRGALRWLRRDNILFVQWSDSKVVTVATTHHSAEGYVFDKRRCKVGNDWRQINVRKPKVIDEYNQYMSGVDKSDQMISTYNVLRKCLRWWKTLFFHCLDISAVNSYVIFRHLQQMYPEVKELRRPAGFSQLEFREELVTQLLNLEEEVVPCATPPPSGSRWESADPDYKTSHWPDWTETRINCVVCYKLTHTEVKSYIQCGKCETALCINKTRNCFKTFHSKAFDRHR